MQGLKLLKKFLLPGGLCGAVPVIKPEPISPQAPVDCSADGAAAPRILRPSELPIYVLEPQKRPKPQTRDPSSVRAQIEDGFGAARRSVAGVTDQFQAFQEKITHFYNTGLAHTKGSIDFLRQEENLLPRIGTIFGGGLAGLLLGIRGGKIKRFFFISSGAGAMAAICYPEGARETLNSGKHYVNIGYNFVYGVKPGDANQKEIKWPELPSFKLPENFSDFVVLVKDTGTGVAASIGDLIKAPEEKQEIKPTEAKQDAKNK